MISVIVPVYKVEEYLRGCLDSIVGQTYRNLQIILVDDGSPDCCGEICDEYAKRDERILVIHKENGGVSSARNEGLKAAKGEWIGFVDSDDYLEADMYEYLLGLTVGQKADMVQCGLFIDEPDSSELMYCAQGENRFFANAGALRLADMKLMGYSSCNKLFRTAALDGFFFDPECSMGEDFLFNLRVLEKAEGIMIGMEAKYHYIQRDGSACHVPPDHKSVHSHRKVYKQAADQFQPGTDIHEFFLSERLRMDMHNCSKMVRFPEWEIKELKAEIRHDLRKETWEILRSPGTNLKEKTKLMLIAWAWWLYRPLLLESKKRK